VERDLGPSGSAGEARLGPRVRRQARTAGEDTYTIRQAADRLGVSYDSVHVHYRELGGFRVGRRILLPRSVVDRLVAGPEAPPAADLVPIPPGLHTVDHLLAAADRLPEAARWQLVQRLLERLQGARP
jgi:excisionase family DNA binding protein